jgi:hypothetical protein
MNKARKDPKLPFAAHETSAVRAPCEGAPGIRTSVPLPVARHWLHVSC